MCKYYELVAPCTIQSLSPRPVVHHFGRLRSRVLQVEVGILPKKLL